VNFFVLSRNRVPPAKDADEYVDMLYESLQWFDLAMQADFLFFFVMFDFHGLLAPRPINTKVYPMWLKSYRDLIAEALGTSFSSPDWQHLMEFLRKLPDKLEEAQREISYTNVTKNLVNGSTESYERFHVEHSKLWCAMRYHPVHWESTDSLRALLAEIEHKECRYDVPLFSQYADFHKNRSKPRSGKR
jgi:hypothetical protein